MGADPAGRDQLLSIATGEAFSESATPLLFTEMTKRLFLGLATNLYLESTVSVLTLLVKRHPHAHSLTINHVFRFRIKLEDE